MLKSYKNEGCCSKCSVFFMIKAYFVPRVTSMLAEGY